MQRERFFPAELIRDLPHVPLTGDQMLSIEQHHGMVSYQPDCIMFRTSAGDLTVMGSDLSVSRYTECEAVLTGQISAVRFREAEG